MTLIDTLPELIDNTLYLERMLSSRNTIEKGKAFDLVRRGTCFLRYTVDGRTLFAPSRFIGYKRNSIKSHIESRPHGSITNSRIIKVIGQEPVANKKIDQEYRNFCQSYGIQPNDTGNFGATRRFWDLESFTTNVYGDIELPEGRKKNVIHVTRERNPRLRQIAINNFLAKHKRLYCEACTFDFEKTYGDIGRNFIECHHTIPVSKMQPGHKTKPEDIALLCSNCHRIVHKSKDWLTLEQLKKIIERQKNSR